jgi:hypothetical protein
MCGRIAHAELSGGGGDSGYEDDEVGKYSVSSGRMTDLDLQVLNKRHQTNLNETQSLFNDKWSGVKWMLGWVANGQNGTSIITVFWNARRSPKITVLRDIDRDAPDGAAAIQLYHCQDRQLC